MSSATPRLQLETLFVLDDRGRIVSTREPRPDKGPAFILIRGATDRAWALGADVADEAAEELESLARREGPGWERPPDHARRYESILRSEVSWGPAFKFPDPLDPPLGVEEVAARRIRGLAAGN